MAVPTEIQVAETLFAGLAKAMREDATRTPPDLPVSVPRHTTKTTRSTP